MNVFVYVQPQLSHSVESDPQSPKGKTLCTCMQQNNMILYPALVLKGRHGAAFSSGSFSFSSSGGGFGTNVTITTAPTKLKTAASMYGESENTVWNSGV